MPTKFKWGLLKREAAAYAKLLRLPYILDKIQDCRQATHLQEVDRKWLMRFSTMR